MDSFFISRCHYLFRPVTRGERGRVTTTFRWMKTGQVLKGPIRLPRACLKLRPACSRKGIPHVFPGLTCLLGSPADEIHNHDKSHVMSGVGHLTVQGEESGVLENLILVKHIYRQQLEASLDKIIIYSPPLHSPYINLHSV